MDEASLEENKVLQSHFGDKLEAVWRKLHLRLSNHESRMRKRSGRLDRYIFKLLRPFVPDMTDNTCCSSGASQLIGDLC